MGLLFLIRALRTRIEDGDDALRPHSTLDELTADVFVRTQGHACRNNKRLDVTSLKV